MIPAVLSRAINRFTTATIGYQKVRDKDRIARNHEQHLRAFFEEQSRLTLMHFTRMREYFPPDIPIKALEAGNPVKPEALKKLNKIWSDIEKETDEDLQNVILGVEKDGILSGADQLNRAAIGTLKQRQKDRLARKHRPRIAAFFRSQKRAVLDALAKEKYLFAESYRRLTEDTTQLTLAQFDRIWDTVSDETISELQRVVFNAEVDGVSAGADQLKKLLPFDSSKKAGTTFNLANPRSVQYFKSTGGSVDYIKGINRTTGDSLKRVIGTALDEGWSYSQTAREIQKLYDGPISRDRAQRIAVYETGRSYEKGNELFARSLEDDGVTMEEHWETSKDEKVRPEHTANEAEGWVPMGHVFSSGHTEPPTDPGCRCYMVYRQAPKK